MTSCRKTCLYKYCEKEPGNTLFKFPIEKDRFIIWCLNAGLNLRGKVNITDARYLCEKHFSSKYINNQARRKMLVHTAIPEAWSDKVELLDDPGFTIIGSLPESKRKIREYSMSEMSLKPAVNIEKSPPKLLNARGTNSIPSSSSRQEIEDDDSQTTDDHSSEMYKILTKRSKIDTDSNETFFEEVVLQPQLSQNVSPQVRYLYVKAKGKSDINIPKTVTNIRSPGLRSSKPDSDTEQFAKIEEDIPEYLEDDADISSTHIDDHKLDATRKPSLEIQQNDSTNLPPGYKEFIFEGKMWVQMEKKVFEDELEKARRETERYKILLRKLKSHLNKLDL